METAHNNLDGDILIGAVAHDDDGDESARSTRSTAPTPIRWPRTATGTIPDYLDVDDDGDGIDTIDEDGDDPSNDDTDGDLIATSTPTTTVTG